jgi:hypothetical protein
MCARQLLNTYPDQEATKVQGDRWLPKYVGEYNNNFPPKDTYLDNPPFLFIALLGVWLKDALLTSPLQQLLTGTAGISFSQDLRARDKKCCQNTLPMIVTIRGH